MGMMDRMEALRQELKRCNPQEYFYVQDLFEDSLVISVSTDYWDIGGQMLQIPYLIQDGIAAFGSPQEVERISTYLPVEELADDPPATHQQEKVEYQLVQGTRPYAVPIQTTEAANLRLIFDADVLEQAKTPDGREKGITFKDGVATVFEIQNANGQYYPRSVWLGNIEQLNTRAQDGKCLGEADHPIKGSVTRQCVKFDKFWIEAKEVHCQGAILPTSVGKDLMILASNDIPIALSSRGYGSVKLEEVDGKKMLVVQDDFYCETFDVVWKPAAYDSYIEKFEQAQIEKAPKVLEQSITKGEQNPMDKVLKEIAMLRGRLEAMQEAGQDVKHLTEQLDALEQMSVTDPAPSDASIMAILGPFKAMVKTTPPVPADPDDDKPNFEMATFAQSKETKKPINQEVPDPVEELTQEDIEAHDIALTECLKGYSDEKKKMLQALMKPHKTAIAVLENFAAVKEKFNQALGIVPFGTPAGIGLTKNEKQYEQAPKNAEEAIRHLSEGIEEKVDPDTGLASTLPDNPRGQFEKLIRNISQACPYIMDGYLAYAQGRPLNQAGEMVVANYVTTYAHLLPIIRRTWPKLIAPQIASIQIIDKPTADIFFINTFNEEGANLADYHYYTYANGIAEFANAKKINFKLTKDTITCISKKLKVVSSYENIQDLRSLYGMDALQVGMEMVAGEIAREWNDDILQEMLFATGTAGNTQFGTIAPSGWTQADWGREMLKLYLQKVSNTIYATRNAPMTHLVTGTNNAIQLQKLGNRYGFVPSGNDVDQIYAGVNIFGTIDGKYTVLTTPLYDLLAGGKILCLRKGPDWSDTAYVFAPYTLEMEPPIHGKDGDFSVTQGLMSRAGKKVVVPKAMATLEFVASEGVAL